MVDVARGMVGVGRVEAGSLSSSVGLLGSLGIAMGICGCIEKVGGVVVVPKLAGLLGISCLVVLAGPKVNVAFEGNKELG